MISIRGILFASGPVITKAKVLYIEKDMSEE